MFKVRKTLSSWFVICVTGFVNKATTLAAVVTQVLQQRIKAKSEIVFTF